MEDSKFELVGLAPSFASRTILPVGSFFAHTSFVFAFVMSFFVLLSFFLFGSKGGQEIDNELCGRKNFFSLRRVFSTIFCPDARMQEQ